MRIEFTREEAARIMAHHYAQQTIRAHIERLQGQFNSHSDALGEIEREVRARVAGIPDIPMAGWTVQIDDVTLTGGAIIEKGEE